MNAPTGYSPHELLPIILQRLAQMEEKGLQSDSRYASLHNVMNRLRYDIRESYAPSSCSEIYKAPLLSHELVNPSHTQFFQAFPLATQLQQNPVSQQPFPFYSDDPQPDSGFNSTNPSPQIQQSVPPPGLTDVQKQLLHTQVLAYKYLARKEPLPEALHYSIVYGKPLQKHDNNDARNGKYVWWIFPDRLSMFFALGVDSAGGLFPAPKETLAPLHPQVIAQMQQMRMERTTPIKVCGVDPSMIIQEREHM